MISPPKKNRANNTSKVVNDVTSVRDSVWLIEMFNAAEPIANVKFEYVFVPWDQALRLLRAGSVDAVFNSSYKPERAVYGAYPMKDGKPDPGKATLEYNYSFYIHAGSPVEWDGDRLTNLDGPVGVEKSASIVTALEKSGLPTEQVRNYESLVSLLAGQRLSAIAAIEDIVDLVVRENAARFGGIRKLTPPIQRRVGYLMFSKRYCEVKRSVCQAVWNAIGQVRRSDAFKAMRARYRSE